MTAAGAVLVVGLAAVFMQDVFFRWSVTPSGRFKDERAPAPPDYSKPESWAMRPATPPPGAWEKPWGVDVFFIAPASDYSGKAWNAAIDNQAAQRVLDDVILPNHAAPFAKAGPVYAPRYRQASLHAELNVTPETDGALLLAYNDVRDAFDRYAAQDNNARGVILVGVGQGGLHAVRLLQDRFQQEPMKERLAAAYIIDAALPLDLLGASISQPLCASPDDIHCVTAWTALVDGDASERRRFAASYPSWTADGAIVPTRGRELACINPLLWNASSDLAPRNDHRGGAHADGSKTEPRLLPNTVSTRCVDGALVVDRPTSPALQPSSGWGARYKAPAYNLFYADLMFNASERARAASVWLDENGRKPATPLPPVFSLPDAPIHRPDGKVDPVR